MNSESVRYVPLSRLPPENIEVNLFKRIKDFDLKQFRAGTSHNEDVGSYPSPYNHESIWDYWRRLSFINRYFDPINIAVLYRQRIKDQKLAKDKVLSFVKDLAKYYSSQDVDSPTSLKYLAAHYYGGSPIEYFNYIHIDESLIDKLRDQDDSKEDEEDEDLHSQVLEWCFNEVLKSWFGRYANTDNSLFTEYLDSLSYHLYPDDEAQEPSRAQEQIVINAVFTINIWTLSLIEAILDPLNEIAQGLSLPDFDFNLDNELEDLQLSRDQYLIAKTSLHHYTYFKDKMSASAAYKIFMNDMSLNDPEGTSRNEIIEKKYIFSKLNALGWLKLAKYDEDDIMEVIKSENINVEYDNVDRMSNRLESMMKENVNPRIITHYLLKKKWLDDIDPLGFQINYEIDFDVTDTNILTDVDSNNTQMSDFYYVSMKIHYQIDVDTTIDIFRRTDTNLNIPFILAKDGKNIRIKVLSKDERLNNHNIEYISSQIIDDADIRKEGNFLSFAVWLRKEFRTSKNNNLQEFTRSYTYVKIRPELGELEINVSSIYLNTVIENVTNTFGITINRIKWQSSLGSFYMVGTNFKNHVGFAETIRNNPMYHYFLNQSEVGGIKSENSRIKMNYTELGVERYHKVDNELEPSDTVIKDSSRTLQITISSSSLPKDEILIINGNKWRLSSNTSAFQISLSKISKHETVSSFRGVFKRLWKQWNRVGSPQMKLWWKSLFKRGYNMSNPTVENIKIPKLNVSRKLHNTGTTLVILQNISPKLFGGEYTMKCPKQKQPHIILPEEKERIENENLWRASDGSDVKINPEDILEYSLNTENNGIKTLHMICPHQKYHYPNLSINKDPQSVDIQTCIPCCGENKVNIEVLKKQCLRENFKWQPSAPKTGNPLYEEQQISFDDNLKRMLGFDGIIRGIGYPDWYTREFDNNTMIRAVLEAINNRTYRSAKFNIQEKFGDSQLKAEYALRKYVKDLRLMMALSLENNTYDKTGPLRQEMYNYNKDDIIDKLSDNNLFDSRLYYRLLEIVFQINIFTVVYNYQDKIYEFELPKTKNYHIRNMREIPTVILVRHDYGNDKSYYNYITPLQNSDGSVLSLNLTRIVYRNYYEVNEVTTVRVDDLSSKITVYKNVYQSYDIFARLGSEIMIQGQFIDSDGHTIGLIVGLVPRTTAKLYEEYDNILVISIPPSQPENVPVVSDMYEFISKIKTLRSVESVESILGLKALAKTNNGVWMSLEVDMNTNQILNRSSIHVICDISKSNLPEGPTSPIQSPLNFNRNNRLRILRRIQKIVVGLIDYSYAVYAYNNIDHNYLDFIDNYTYIDDSEHKDNPNFDSVNEYRPKSLEQNIFLEQTQDVDRTMVLASKYVEGLVLMTTLPGQDDRLRYRFYNEKFSKSIAYHLKKKFSMILRPVIPSKIILQKEVIVSGNSTVFNLISDFRIWMKNRIKYNEWVTEFNLNNTVPIPYKSDIDSYYIIQPTRNKEIAVVIATYWHYYKRNIGEVYAEQFLRSCRIDIDKILNEVFSVKQYDLDMNKLVLVSNDNVGMNRPVMELISSDNKWAAALPLAVL